MRRRVLWVSCCVVVGSVLTVANFSASGKDEPDAKAAETKAKTDDKAAETKTETAKKTVVAKKDPLRLPPYYGDVINDDQREKVAGAYAKYNVKLAKLKGQLKSLTAERDKALEDLLTADQKDKLAKVKEEAKAKRTKTAAK